MEFLFAVAWIALGIAGFCLFYLGSDVVFKRRYFRWYVIGSGVLFLGFIAAVDRSWGALAFMAPAVALISFLSLRATRFCGACGKTVVDSMPFSQAEFCSGCGARFEAETPRA